MMKKLLLRVWMMHTVGVVGVWTRLLTITAAFSSTSIRMRSGRTPSYHRASMIDAPEPLVAVFSDVDGTLVHYPQGSDRRLLETTNDDGNKMLKLPPSATGMQGVISSGTLVKCQELRRSGSKLVLVSGMRTSTLLKRLPFLPLADAYCAEGGGRIFYRVTLDSGEDEAPSFVVYPEAYDGATPKDLQPFTLREDSTWRQKMEQPDAAGTDGFIGVEVDTDAAADAVPLKDRAGALWEYAQELVSQGYVLDIDDYATNFRVNRKQQTTKDAKENFQESLLAKTSTCPPGISTSTNLGCVDFYPSESGKKNW